MDKESQVLLTLSSVQLNAAFHYAVTAHVCRREKNEHEHVCASVCKWSFDLIFRCISVDGDYF